MPERHESDSPVTLWNVSSLEAFARFRLAFQPVNSRIVTEVLNQYAPDGRILEIGSGLGELTCRLVPPEIARRIQQSDISPELIIGNITRNFSFNIVRADVADLSAFVGQDFAHVVSLAAFDTMDDIRAALREVLKVLPRGGRFCHFLDINADPDKVFEHLKTTGDDRIPIPVIDGGFYLLTLPQFKLLADAVRQGRLNSKILSAPLFNDFITHPRRVFAKMKLDGISHRGEYPKTLHALQQLMTELGLISEAAYIHPNNLFFDRMRHALDEVGMTVLEFGTRTRDVIWEDTNNVLRDRNEVNTYRNTVGMPSFEKDPSLADIQVRIKSTIHVAVAESLKKAA